MATGHAVPSDDRDTMRALYVAGLAEREIGDLLGYNHATVHGHVVDLTRGKGRRSKEHQAAARLIIKLWHKADFYRRVAAAGATVR